jgi:polar amino acid transport system substrate-binding protein
MMRPLPALMFASLSAAAAGMTVDAHAVVAAMQVRVGMGLAKPPYIMESGRNGIEYEIAEQALAASGYRMQPLQFPPTRALALLRAGQLDMLLSVDEGIGGGNFFSDTYLLYQNVAMTLTSRHIMLRHVEDLLRYSVAGFQNANTILGEDFRHVTATHTDYREYPQQITQDKLLFSGRVDVVVGDRLIFRYFSSRMETTIDGRQPVTYHAIFPPSPRKAAFRNAALRDRFNAGLKTIRQNGTYDAILKKYQDYM